MAEGDLLHRFLFESLPIRGHLVRLDASWRAAIEHHDYPRPVSDALGEAMAASVLMAGSLKFEGRLSLQIEGRGPVRLMLAQCTHRHAIRGVARHRAVANQEVAALFEGGQLAVTIEQDGRPDRYQGVVPLDRGRLSGCLEQYFERSEQLPSRMLLAATTERAAGLLLQRVAVDDAGPDLLKSAAADDAWRRVTLLAGTLEAPELLNLPCRDVLRRLFREDDIRLFQGTAVYFQCSCSRERVSSILQALGAEELQSLLRERGDVEVRCEFCNRGWRFDAVDIAGLFIAGDQQQAPRGLH